MLGRTISVSIAFCLILLPACGDDAPSGPDPEAFCETWDQDAGQIPENDAAWDIYADTFEDLAVLAPADIRAEMETMSDAVSKVADGSQNFDDIYLEPGVSKASDTYRTWTSIHCSDGGGYFPGG